MSTKKRRTKKVETGIYSMEPEKSNKRCMKWLLYVPLPKANGEYQQKKKVFNGTLGDAKRERSRLLVEYGNKPKIASDVTVGQRVLAFVHERADSRNYSQRTLATDEYRARVAYSLLGDVRLVDLTAERLNSAYARLRAGESLSSKPISGSTARGVHKFLKMALREPMKQGLVNRDIYDDVIAPLDDTQEKVALSTAQAIEFISALDPANPRMMGLMMCITLGLRQSESLGVRWEDVDDRILHVKRSLNPDGSEKDPKTFKGRRELPILKDMQAAFDIRREAQKEAINQRYELLLRSGELNGRTLEDIKAEFIYVCHDDPDNILKPDTFKSWWRYHRDSYGMNSTMHGLRHTYITMLARAGVSPRIMQKFAGHSNSRITQEVYNHVDDEDIMRAAATMQDMFDRAKEQVARMQKDGRQFKVIHGNPAA